jgi:type VI secretion system secreted protein Hcp
MKTLLKSAFTALLCSVLVSSAQAGAGSCFLRVDGIPGESTAVDHQGDIDLVGFKTGIIQKLTAATGSGLAAGKPDFGPLKVFKYLDKASSGLFIACAVGRHIKKVTLFVSSGDTVAEAGPVRPAGDFFKIVLSDVVISSINDGTDTTDSSGNLLETVVFEFTRIEWTYIPANSDGQPQTPITGGYDLKTGRRL